MAAAHAPSLYMSLGVAVLVAWRMYYRIRRVIGRQPYHRIRPWLTVTLAPLLLLWLLHGLRLQPQAEAALLGGCLLGVGLGVLGLRLTRFEVTPAGRFYTPNAHLGIALSLLMVGRVVYRLFFSGIELSEPPTHWVSSPLTLLLMGTLLGYYLSYAVGLLRWRYVADNKPARLPPNT